MDFRTFWSGARGVALAPIRGTGKPPQIDAMFWLRCVCEAARTISAADARLALRTMAAEIGADPVRRQSHLDRLPAVPIIDTNVLHCGSFFDDLGGAKQLKIGFCMLSWGEPVDEPRHAMIGKIAEHGYDGIEIPVVHGLRSGYAALAEVLDDLGLERTALTVMPPGTNPVSPDPAIRQAAMDRIAWCLDSVSALGAKLLVGPVHQTLKAFTGLPPSAAEFARLGDFHRYAGDLAAERGIIIAIEPMCRFESHLLNTMAGLATYLASVAHPAVTGMYDTFHANIEEADPVGALGRHIGNVGHFHVSESDRGVPGRGHVPWKETFATLKRGGYEGWLTVESFGRTDPGLAAATCVWRDLTPGAETIVAESIRHIRDVWEAV